MRIVHAGLDRLAMWSEDRRPHAAQPYVTCEAAALDCAGPLEAIPPPPAQPGPWSAPSPRPQRRGDRMMLVAIGARAPFRGTAVLVPPWKIRSASLVGGYAKLLAREGFDVWIVVPPEHMERAEPGTPSGHGFATLDVGRFRGLFAQMVVEIRTSIAMASRRGPVGVLGLSIGALAASFAITASERPDFAALVAPPADLAAILSETAIGRRYRALAERAGSQWPDAGELRRVLTPFNPLQRPPPRSRVLLAVGRHDAIALPARALALAKAWGVPAHVYPRGHLSLLFCCRALRRDLVRFVSGGGPSSRAA